MDASIAQCRYLLSLSESIFDGLEDSHRALEPQLGLKTAGWLIGHLAVSGDFARYLCGRDPLCPRAWTTMFNPGTEPMKDPQTYPPMVTLCSTFRLVYTDLLTGAREADPAVLSAENPFTPARRDFPTVAEFVEYLLTSHLAYHLGQLVAWRAAIGLGRLRRRNDLAA